MDLTQVTLVAAAWIFGGWALAIGFFSLGFGFRVRRDVRNPRLRRRTALTASRSTRRTASTVS